MARPLNSLLDNLDNAPETGTTVPVLIPVALDQTYDYLLPDGLQVAPGDFVIVPFGSQTRLGIVWDRLLGPQPDKAPKKMKAVVERIDVPALPELSLRFAEWIARYTLTPAGMVARIPSRALGRSGCTSPL